MQKKPPCYIIRVWSAKSQRSIEERNSMMQGGSK